jgi:hypothetical protein
MKIFQLSSVVRSFFDIAISVLLACVAYGQSQTTSNIQGIAIDKNGAAIPGVRVMAACDCKECPNRPCTECCPSGFHATVTTDDEGRFRIEKVPPGVYLVSGEVSGFAAVKVHRVEVTEQNAGTVTLKFEKGAAEGAAAAATAIPNAATSTTTNVGTSADSARLEVKVIDRQTDLPLENAKVTLLLQCDCKKECPTKPCSECCPSEKQMFTSVTNAAGVVTFAGPPGTYRIDTEFRAYSKDSLVKVDAGETEKFKVTLAVKEKP